jgi:hypothetical protein
MNFHSTCLCRLINMTEKGGPPRYDIMSENEHVGSLRFCNTLDEWMIHLSSHVSATYGFMSKVWMCLLDELTEARSLV